MLLTLALSLMMISESASASPPRWALSDTQRLSGTRLRIVCAGSGPSIRFARQDALDSCKASAAQQVLSEITVKSISITTEREATLQQEVWNESQVSGLSCLPKREEIEEHGAEVRLWLLCEFDLSKAHPSRSTPLASNSQERDQQKEDLKDESNILTLAVVPSCTDLIIRGQGLSRIIRCRGNPISVTLDPLDREIILRAKDRIPKSIFLGPHREPRGYVQVVLEPT